MKLLLTKEEEEIFEIIRKFAVSLNPAVVPRIVGGFVRDRIRGIPNHDIDVAVDTISGFEFAVRLNEYDAVGNSKVHKISANPEKSKHLETAILNMHGYDIDFAQLRTEVYTNSRIPTIQVGTPEEDAFRRDLTINCLFYNLITGEIEDFTGRGLSDLEMGIIDTPNDPVITFLDDPLRILRVFRFKCKFKFKISQRIYDALKNPMIGDSFENKISAERIAIELTKMLEYSNGTDGLLEIVENGLVHPVFKPTIEIKIDSLDFQRSIGDLEMLIGDLESQGYLLKLGARMINIVLIKLYLILQFFLGKKILDRKKETYLNVYILENSLKLPKEMFGSAKEVEGCIECILKAGMGDSLEFVLNCKDHWLKVLIILFLRFRDQKYQKMIFTIFDEKRHDVHLVPRKIDGHFLIAVKTPMNDFPKLLFACHYCQIKNPNLSQEEIYRIGLEMVPRLEDVLISPPSQNKGRYMRIHESEYMSNFQ